MTWMQPSAVPYTLKALYVLSNPFPSRSGPSAQPSSVCPVAGLRHASDLRYPGTSGSEQRRPARSLLSH